MSTSDTAQVAQFQVPLDRAHNPDGQRLNVGVQHARVQVVINPQLHLLGQVDHAYGGSTITLREWNEQVLLHELLHVVLDPVLVQGDPQDPHGHNIISRVEVALWETGWRMSSPSGQVTP